MMANAPTTPTVTVKHCLHKTEPIVRFRTDEGKVHMEQFLHLRGIYDEELQTLSITTADGTIAITGPGAWDVCECVCGNRITMIRTDGKEITSVRFIPKETDL